MRFARCDRGLAGDTFRQAVIRVDRGDLEATFGQAEPVVDGKSSAVWTLIFEDESVATVYDYHGDEWHIGGHGPLAADHVVEALRGAGCEVGRVTEH